MFFNTVELKFRYESVRGIGQGGNQPALNGDLVKSIPIPVPPLDEITQICDLVEKQLAAISYVESELAYQWKLIEAQRQTILREAFRGVLVEQDPADESAAVLLQRIVTSRFTVTPAAKRGNKNNAERVR